MTMNWLLERFGLERDGVTSLAIRVSSMFVKLLFTVMIARIISQEEFGRYIFVTMAVLFFVFIVGLEFHTYSIRKYVAQEDVRAREKVLITHFGVVISISVAIVFLLYFVILLHDFWAYYNAVFLVFLFWLELLITDLTRFLRAGKQIVSANIAGAIQSASWLPFIYILVSTRIITSVEPCNMMILGWVIADCVALVYCLFVLNMLNVKILIQLRFPSIVIFRAGMIECWRFYLIAVFNQLRNQFSKIVLLYYMNARLLGIFGYYQMFSSAVDIYIQTGIIAVNFPALIKSGLPGGHSENARPLLEKLLFKCIKHAFVVSGAVLVIVYGIVQWQYSIYTDYLYIFPVLLVGQIFLSTSALLHTFLYGRRMDAGLFVSDALIIVIALFLGNFMVRNHNIFGACLLNLIIGGLSFVLKGYLSYSSCKPLCPHAKIP